MSFLGTLRAGVLGVTLDVPASYEVLSDDADTASVADREHAIVWHFFSAPILELDLDQLESQRRDAASYAKHVGGDLVSCERIMIGDAPALSILHRTSDERTASHVLAPTGEGLFEARWVGPDGSPAESWIRQSLRVVKPARPFPRGEVVLKDLGCALVPPPRFVRQAANKRFALFCRVSLAVTDGLHYCSVQRRKGGDIAELLDDRTHELIRADKMMQTAKQTPAAPAGVDACLVTDAARDAETRRYISVGVRESAGSAALMTLICTPSDPPEPLVEELAAAARTYRVVKPWWQVW